jgi:hypothetical protein
MRPGGVAQDSIRSPGGLFRVFEARKLRIDGSAVREELVLYFFARADPSHLARRPTLCRHILFRLHQRAVQRSEVSPAQHAARREPVWKRCRTGRRAVRGRGLNLRARCGGRLCDRHALAERWQVPAARLWVWSVDLKRRRGGSSAPVGELGRSKLLLLLFRHARRQLEHCACAMRRRNRCLGNS